MWPRASNIYSQNTSLGRLQLASDSVALGGEFIDTQVGSFRSQE